MREFILCARRGPTSADFSWDQAPRERHLEVVAHCIVNALFCSRQVRTDTRIHVVLDGPSAPPKTVRVDGAELGSLAGLDERSIWDLIRRALAAGADLRLGEEVQSEPGVSVAKQSFEHLVRARCDAGDVFYLRPKGVDIRSLAPAAGVCCVLTDHLAMPRKTDRFLDRLGARPVSLGPTMLFASQCISIVHHELDRLAVAALPES